MSISVSEIDLFTWPALRFLRGLRSHHHQGMNLWRTPPCCGGGGVLYIHTEAHGCASVRSSSARCLVGATSGRSGRCFNVEYATTKQKTCASLHRYEQTVILFWFLDDFGDFWIRLRCKLLPKGNNFFFLFLYTCVLLSARCVWKITVLKKPTIIFTLNIAVLTTLLHQIKSSLYLSTVNSK